MGSFTDAVKYTAKHVLLQADKHSPEIFLGLGLIGLGVGVGLACRATLKVSKKVDDFSKKKEEVERKRVDAATEKVIAKAEKREPSIIFTDEDAKAELSNAKKALMADMAKIVLPVALELGLSTASILHAYGIINDRYLTNMALYMASERACNAYRARVRERFGDEVDMELMTGAKKATGIVTETDKDGNTTETEKEVMTAGNSVIGPDKYNLWFERGATPLWQVNSIDNESFLLSQQAYFENKLQAEGFVILAEVYRALGYAPTSESLVVGWVKNSAIGDGHVSFFGGGKPMPVYKETGEQINPTGRIIRRLSGAAYYLDFNVDGCIYGLI